jgi:hypothetical protein
MGGTAPYSSLPLCHESYLPQTLPSAAAASAYEQQRHYPTALQLLPAATLPFAPRRC